MKDNVLITLIANAGVLVEYKGTKILIDGIHYDNRHYFSKVSDEVLKSMTEGNGKLRNIDYLLFTHNHVDHFSPKYTMKYLERNTISRIYMPKTGDGKFNELQNFILDKDIPYRFLEIPLGKKISYMLNENMGITIFNTVHMGDQFKDVENYCYVITAGEQNILFTADADYNLGYYRQVLGNLKIDVVFINPLYLNSADGRKVVTEVLKPKKTVIYHIPFEEDDKVNFRKMVKKDTEKHKRNMPEIIILSDEFQIIEL